MKLDTLSITRHNPQFTVILCHGFGASKHDLAGLVEWLDPAERFSWHFPQAPMALPGFGGWAWFPRDTQALMQTMSGDYFNRLETVVDPGLLESAAELAEFANGLPVAADKLVLGGFSQGSMVALQAILSAGLKPAGLMLLSGSLIDRAGTTTLLSAATPCPVFQSHGRSDQVLTIDGGRQLRILLQSAGFPVTWCEFGGGHEINETVVRQSVRFLESLR